LLALIKKTSIIDSIEAINQTVDLKMNTQKLRVELNRLTKKSLKIYRDGFVRGSWSSDEVAQEYYSNNRKFSKLREMDATLRDKKAQANKMTKEGRGSIWKLRDF